MAITQETIQKKNYEVSYLYINLLKMKLSRISKAFGTPGIFKLSVYTTLFSLNGDRDSDNRASPPPSRSHLYIKLNSEL